VLWRMAIILKANKVNLFVSSVLFVFWYHSPNFLDTPRRWRYVWSIRGMTMTGGNRSTGRKPCHSIPLPTIWSETDWPGIELGSPRWEAVDEPPDPWHDHLLE
jgi:hypothetical protein